MTNREIRGVLRLAEQTNRKQAAGGIAPNAEGLCAKIKQAIVVLRMAEAKREAKIS